MSHALTRRAFLTTALAASSLPLMRIDAFAQATNQIELVARKADIALAGSGAPNSTLWTYNGVTPGPMLRVQQGRPVDIAFRNELDEPTSVHWHGLRIDNAMDGVAGLTQDPVPPGQTFNYRFTPPDAGTFWYHAHNLSWQQVAMGLYGPLVVEEADGAPFASNNDITMVFDDWRLNQQGTLDVNSLGNMMDWGHQGRLGNFLTVNGQSRPTLQVPGGEWVRLRMINAANARIFTFDLSVLDAQIIALDGQPVAGETINKAGRVSLGPAQRVDLRVRFAKADRVVINEVSGQPFETAYLEVKEPIATAPDGPGPALPAARIPEPVLADALSFEMSLDGGAMSMANLTFQGRPVGGMGMMMGSGQMWGLNGIANLAEDPFFAVKAGQSVIVKTTNRTRFDHAMHIHGHHFRILERKGVAQPLDQWRDTFLIAPNETVTIAFVADNPGKWLYHCHMLEHAAGGMTTWFKVA